MTLCWHIRSRHFLDNF